MGLLIENLHNVFYIKGVIDQSNYGFLKRYISFQFSRYQKIIIDINEVQKIDKKGMDTFAFLYLLSLREGKGFTIVGYGCKDVYNQLLAA